MRRRTFLGRGLTLSAGALVSGATGWPAMALAETQLKGWRAYEVKTSIDIAAPAGISKAWIPLPFTRNTPWFRHLHGSWRGNFLRAQHMDYDAHGTAFLFVEWADAEDNPVVEITNRIMTRDRRVSLDGPPDPAVEEAADVKRYYLQPSRFKPTDGIVRKTALSIVGNRTSDVEKARAIYEWIVENTFRDPKVQGCGTGNIKAMLETGNLGGKCADLNSLFVGLARSVGLPARDALGIRCAPSKTFHSLGASGDITHAQHCRAEVYLEGYGWVPVDPADVRKVMLEEKKGQQLALSDPLVQHARKKLFGAWEMNWMLYNYADDVELPQIEARPLPFLMYPQAEDSNGRRNPLDAAHFRYQITSKPLAVTA